MGFFCGHLPGLQCLKLHLAVHYKKPEKTLVIDFGRLVNLLSPPTPFNACLIRIGVILLHQTTNSV